MADWSLPTLSSTYTNFLSQLQARDTDLALGFDGTTSSNLTVGTIRWDSTANRWKKWNGSSWAELTSTYALTGLSTTGNASIGGTFSVTGQTTLATATATTPATADNNTNIATTAFVKAQGYAPLASPTFTGTVTIPSGASIGGYLTTSAAAAAYAPLASPTFTGTVTIPSGASIASPGLTGTPTAPTAAASTNTTQIATTAFVLGQASSTTPATNGTAAVGTGTTFARADHVHATDTSRAPLASPTFTGTPAAPTATAGTNTTQLATTAFVATAVGAIVSVPAGSVSMFAGSTAPSGYLSCDGSEISRITYATLFAAIGTTHGAGNGSTTFNIPDLRGEFIRGLDSGRGIDTGRTLGTFQGSSYASHTHPATVSDPGHTHNVANGFGSSGGAGPIYSVTKSTSGGSNQQWAAGYIQASATGISVSNAASGGTDTLPRNIALLFIIKY
jgi:hypothetical protein